MLLKKFFKISSNKFYNKKNIKFIRKSISDGNIISVKNVVNSKIIRKICFKIITKKMKPSDPRVLQGIKNIFYVSETKKKINKKNFYQAEDKSWYFFPWNKDNSNLTKLVQPIFNNVIKINGYDPKKIVKKKPLDLIVQRFHLIFYPYNSGKISIHKDPSNVVDVQCGIYVTSYNVDYDTGGFYVLDKFRKKIFLDKKIKSGDLVLFSPKIAHGVDPIQNKKIKKTNISGRVFLNMNLIQSHHNKHRKTALGL
jgi:hypothetical protein